eukprot:1160964-Pelagomonas_calceolata.AAC.13
MAGVCSIHQAHHPFLPELSMGCLRCADAAAPSPAMQPQGWQTRNCPQWHAPVLVCAHYVQLPEDKFLPEIRYLSFYRCTANCKW